MIDEIPKNKKDKTFNYNPNISFNIGQKYPLNTLFHDTFVKLNDTGTIGDIVVNTNKKKFCENVLQYYNEKGNAVLRKFIHLILKPIIGSKYNYEDGKYTAWYRTINDMDEENILTQALPEFHGKWSPDVSINLVGDHDVNMNVYKPVLKYSKNIGNNEYEIKLDADGKHLIIPEHLWNFDLKNGVIGFIDYEQIKDEVNETTPPILTFVKYIGQKVKDIEFLITHSLFYTKTDHPDASFNEITHIQNKIESWKTRPGITFDLSGIGYLKVPYKDKDYPMDDIYKKTGAIRYDSLENAFEGYHGDGDGWKSIGGGSGNTSDNSGTEIRISKKDEKEKINGEFNPDFYTHTIEFYTKDPLNKDSGHNGIRRMVIQKDGNVDISNNLNVDGSANITGGINVQNGIKIKDGNVDISNNLNVDGSANITGGINVQNGIKNKRWKRRYIQQFKR